MATLTLDRPAGSVALAASDARRWLGLVVLAAALALDAMSVAVLNTALPVIGTEFAMAPSALQWTMTAYAVTFAGFLLLGGRAADALGRRRVFLAGIVVFTAGSVLGALAVDGTMLIVARALQGVGAAISSPAALALITTLFQPGPARNKAMAVYAAVGSSSFSVGLVLGGVLTEAFGWRSVFWINLPVGIVVLLAARRLVPAGLPDRREGLDLPGAALVTAGLATAIYGITEIHTFGLSALTLGTLAVAAVLLIGFVLRQRTARTPLLPLRLFAARPVGAAAVAAMVSFAVINGVLFFAPMYLQGYLGYSALLSGLAVVPMGATIAVSSTVAGRLMHRTAPRTLMVLGLLLMAAGSALWVGTPADGNYWVHVLPGLVILSAGMGLTFPAMTAAALGGVEQREHGIAGAVNVTAQQVGSGIGIAVLVTAAAGNTLSGMHLAYWIAAAIALVGALVVARRLR